MPIDIPFLSDVYEFELFGIQLMQNLKTWSDKISFRNAVHEFLNRDGASVEYNGRKPATFTFAVYFSGPNWRIQYNNLIAKWSQSSKTQCVHPLLGPINVAVDEIEATSTPATGRNLLEATIRVTEDRLDLQLAREQEPRPSELAQQAVSLSTQAADDIATKYQLALGTARKYVSAVASYTALAQAAQLDPIAALELRSNLSLVVTASEAVLADLLSDPTAVDQCDVMDEVDAIILAHSACIELYDALNGEGVFPEQVKITGAQSLIQWCAARYGGPAAERYAEIIERMNYIPDVGWLQPNTVLLAPAKKET